MKIRHNEIKRNKGKRTQCVSKQFCCENTEKTDNLILYYNFNFEVMSSNSTYYESSALRKSNSATLRFFFRRPF